MYMSVHLYVCTCILHSYFSMVHTQWPTCVVYMYMYPHMMLCNKGTSHVHSCMLMHWTVTCTKTRPQNPLKYHFLPHAEHIFKWNLVFSQGILLQNTLGCLELKWLDGGCVLTLDAILEPCLHRQPCSLIKGTKLFKGIASRPFG